MSQIRYTGADGPTDINAISSRQNAVIQDVPVASRSYLSTLTDEEKPTSETWSSKPLEDTYNPLYEYVQTTQTESGHTIEYDDTPGYERIAHTHASGTFHEFQADGSEQCSIRGDSYKLVAGDNFVYIVGNCNLTVDGDVKTLVNGNYHLEVVGDYTETVHGNRLSKVHLSSLAEIGEDHGTNIGRNQIITVTGTRRDTVQDDVDFTCAGSFDTTIIGDRNDTTLSRHFITSTNSMKMNCSEPIHIQSEGTIHCTSPVFKASGDVLAGGGNVSLITHLHTQNNGNDAGGGVDVSDPIGGTGVGA